MCALPSSEAPQQQPRTRITPIQWVGLAAVVVLFVWQLGIFDPTRGFRGMDVTDFLLFVAAIILAVTIHEFSHAAVAYLFGDPLAKNLGRLTLNPLRHLDLMGSLLFLIAGFGWGKPVPINPNAMRNPGLGWALSSVAGPVSNFATAAVVLLFVMPLVMPALDNDYVDGFLIEIVRVSVLLGVFNLLPLPPLDGSGFVFGLSPRPLRALLWPLQAYGPFILLGLIFLPQIMPGVPSIIQLWVQFGARLFFNLLGV